MWAGRGRRIFGLRGQANYCIAKSGIIGLSKAIALEGERHGIPSKVIAPVATTRIVGGMRPGDITEEDLADSVRDNPHVEFPTGPEFVSSLAAERASENGLAELTGQLARIVTMNVSERPDAARLMTCHLEFTPEWWSKARKLRPR
jgi:NAD(P)-dependent dehydrogenase (short-subunit alcohol dehydrogenase family)